MSIFKFQVFKVNFNTFSRTLIYNIFLLANIKMFINEKTHIPSTYYFLQVIIEHEKKKMY